MKPLRHEERSAAPLARLPAARPTRAGAADPRVSAMMLRSVGTCQDLISSVRLRVDGSRAAPCGAVLKSGTRAAADSSGKSRGWGLLLDDVRMHALGLDDVPRDYERG